MNTEGSSVARPRPPPLGWVALRVQNNYSTNQLQYKPTRVQTNYVKYCYSLPLGAESNLGLMRTGNRLQLLCF